MHQLEREKKRRKVDNNPEPPKVTQKTTSSRFLALPRGKFSSSWLHFNTESNLSQELRDIIYTYALTYATDLQWHPMHVPHSPCQHGCSSDVENPNAFPSLLLVSKQIHTEAEQIFDKNNTFVFKEFSSRLLSGKDIEPLHKAASCTSLKPLRWSRKEHNFRSIGYRLPIQWKSWNDIPEEKRDPFDTAHVRQLALFLLKCPELRQLYIPMELTNFLFQDLENARMREKLGFDWSLILARLFEKDQARLLVRGIPDLPAQRQRNHGWFRLVKVRGCKLRFTEKSVLSFLREIWQQRARHTQGVSRRIHRVKGVEVEWEQSSITFTRPTHTFVNDMTAKIVSG